MGKTGQGTAQDGLTIEGRVGVAISTFNNEMVEILEKGFEEEINSLLAPGCDLVKLKVPGALELGHALRLLANDLNPRPMVLVALGCVIRGETYHFEIVCQQSAEAVRIVGEDTALPVINGILTCETVEQAKQRCVSKGAEFARAASQMASIRRQLSQQDVD